MEKEIEKKFFELFGKGEYKKVNSPGRVNLIGDHTDYQGGFVLPIAIDRYTYFFGRKRDDSKIKIYSFNFNDYIETSFEDIKFDKEKKWINYIYGVVKEFENKRIDLSGFEITYGGNVPVGSGLSSSASVEIGAITLLMKIFELKFTDIEVIKMGKSAENNFVGVNCGIMDQFIIYLGKKESAIFLNCDNLKYSYVPFKTGSYKLLLVDTKKKRELSSSVYNKRVEEVERVVNIIKGDMNINNLGQITPEVLENYKHRLGKIEYKRGKHIVDENERVKKSVEFLKKGDIKNFGVLLYQSHISLKNLYQVSCDELDFIVDFSEDFKSVAGARLTGAGMGGCCIVLIEKDFVDGFKKELSERYYEKFGITPSFYEVVAVNGAKEES